MQKSIKSVVAAAVLFILTLAIQTQVLGLEFSDVNITASYYKAVDELSNQGILQGRGDGVFAPKDKTTRAEFCAVLARANGYSPNYYEPKFLPFVDVDIDNWAYPYISFCYENGYISGMTETEFWPTAHITDEQAVKMVVCSSGIGDESLSKVGPKWYSGYLTVANKHDLLENTEVNISNSSNRGFVAQVVYNATLLKAENEYIDDAVDMGASYVTEDKDYEYHYSKAEIDEKLKDEPDQEIQEELSEEEIKKAEEEAKKEAWKKAKAEARQKAVEKAKKSGKLTVVIDPGHNYSGTDTGAVGNGLREQDITFYIADKTRELLEEKGFYVLMTRETLEDNVSIESVSASLLERAELANMADADLFVSIHCNAGGGSGTETYYCTDSPEGEILAEYIHEAVIDSVGLTDRGIKDAGFAVLRYTDMAAVLLETAFIDNSYDASVLGNKDRQWAFAQGITDGICEYFDLD